MARKQEQEPARREIRELARLEAQVADLSSALAKIRDQLGQ